LAFDQNNPNPKNDSSFTNMLSSHAKCQNFEKLFNEVVENFKINVSGKGNEILDENLSSLQISAF
jgi:hypothetical protein